MGKQTRRAGVLDERAMDLNLDAAAGTGSPTPLRSPKSRPARNSQVPVIGSPPSAGKRSSHASRRKSLAQQIDSAEKPAAAIPAVQSLSPRSPHLGRASRSPKTKSAVSSPQQPMVGEPPNSPKGVGAQNQHRGAGPHAA